MSDIPTKYYRKELYSSPLFLARGVKAPFEPVGNDEGIMATNVASIIFSVDNAIAQRIGGVYQINAEEYELLKKKETATVKSSRLSPSVRSDVRSIGTGASRYLPSLQESQAAAAAPAKDTKPIAPPVTASPRVVRRGKLPTQAPPTPT